MGSQTRIDRRALVGLAVLVGGTFLWVLAFTGGLSTLFGSSTTTVKADFASVENIVPNDPVRIHGVQVGSVSSVTADPGGRGGTLTMNIDTTDPIYADASASILWRTALGANDAVAIDPGTRAAGLLGSATLPQSRDSNQVELDQITSALRDGAQSGIQTMLPQLSLAFSNHPALGQALGTLAQVAPTAAVGVGALRGQVQDTDLQNLIKNAGQAAQAISVGAGASETRRFAQAAANTLTATSATPADLRTSIRILSRLFPLASVNFAALNGSLTKLDGILPALNAAAPSVAPTLRQLHPAVSNLNTLLTDATPLLNELSPTVDSLANTATVGVPLINALSPSLQRVSRTILPGLDQTTPETRGHPAYTLIGGTVVSLGTLSSFVNRDGEMANLTLGLGAANDVGGLLPCNLDFRGTDLLVCNSLSQTLGTLFTGGTSLLSGLLGKPGGQAAYGPLMSAAQKLTASLSSTKRALTKQAPTAARYLFQPGHGGVK
jgi:phospholipid/cholesterol/gamma-HCH transport system substrate-binding protein